MTERLQAITEFAVLLTLPVYQAIASISDFFSDKDLNLLLGENGFKVALLIGLIVVWGVSERREAVNRRDREKHHAEMLSLQAKNFDQIMAIVAESIKGSAKVCGAIERFDANSQRLAIEVSDLTEIIQHCHKKNQ